MHMRGWHVEGLKEKSRSYEDGINHPRLFRGVPPLNREKGTSAYKHQRVWYCGRLISGHTGMHVFHLYKNRFINLVNVKEQTFFVYKNHKNRYGSYVLNGNRHRHRIRRGCYKIHQVYLWSKTINFKKYSKKQENLEARKFDIEKRK